MLQIWREFKLLPILLFFPFPFLHLGPNVLHYGFRSRAHSAQHIDKEAIVITQRFKNIGCFNSFAPLTTSAFHRAFKKVCRIRADAEALTSVLLPAATESFLDSHLHDDWVERKLAHRGVKHVRLFDS